MNTATPEIDKDGVLLGLISEPWAITVMAQRLFSNGELSALTDRLETMKYAHLGDPDTVGGSDA